MNFSRTMMGGEEAKHTPQALPEIREEGYTNVTVDQQPLQLKEAKTGLKPEQPQSRCCR